MKHLSLIVSALVLLAGPATAGPIWHSINLSVSPADAPKVVAALDVLIRSTGDSLTGSVSLMSYVASGEGSTSHNIISSFESRAAAESWTQSLFKSDAWKKYAKATDGLTRLEGTARMNFVKTWGKDDPADVFWEIYAFDVSDPPGFVAAIDRLMESDAGKASPASVYLSEVAAAGIAPITHIISVGYNSEAEAESSSATLTATRDWAKYIEAAEKAAENKGAYMMRTIKAWGTVE